MAFAVKRRGGSWSDEAEEEPTKKKKTQKAKSQSTSSHISGRDARLSLIVVTTECQVSDSEPTHRPNIPVHSADSFSLECDGNFPPPAGEKKKTWPTLADNF